MRWHTPKGTIELAPVEETTLQADDRHIAVADLLKDAMTHFNGNRLVEAAALCQTVLRQFPEHADTLHLLGVVHHTSGQHIRAIELLNKAIQINPDEPRYLNDIGEAFRAMDKIQPALNHYDRALALRPDFMEANNNKGVALYNIGHLEKAVQYFEKTLQLKPDYTLALTNLGAVLYDLGREEESIKQYERALELNPESAESLHHIAVIAKLTPDDERTQKILNLLNKEGISVEDAMHLQFALGRVYEGAKQYETAFEHYLKGNALKRKTINFAMQHYVQYADGLVNTYSRDYFDQLPFHGSDSDRPIFIVGMPRSGTTLVEQIVSSHPDVFGAGELPALEHMEQLIPSHLNSNMAYPLCMPQMTAELARQLASQYLEHLNAYTTESPHVTDKMPGNYQRIGLIKTLFPNARIIHCQRHPLDTCVSIFCNYFRGTHNYAYDLTELGLFYRQYARLMHHWQQLFGDAIFDVQYEALTQNQESVSRALIDFLGLQWDDRCIEFHKNVRPVQTASKMQVNKPMYATSVDKWKRYEKYLGPLKEALGDSISPPA